jgi:hypothetical protein
VNRILICGSGPWANRWFGRADGHPDCSEVSLIPAREFLKSLRLGSARRQIEEGDSHNILVIATRPDLQGEILVELAKTPITLIAEKPLGLNSLDVRRYLQIIRAHPRFSINLPNVYDLRLLEALEKLPTSSQSFYNDYGPVGDREYIDVLHDWGVHSLSLAALAGFKSSDIQFVKHKQGLGYNIYEVWFSRGEKSLVLKFGCDQSLREKRISICHEKGCVSLDLNDLSESIIAGCKDPLGFQLSLAATPVDERFKLFRSKSLRIYSVISAMFVRIEVILAA